MNEFKIRLEGAQPLLDQLDGLRHFKAEGIAFENATQIHERASHNKETTPGGSPIDTAELRNSLVLGEMSHGYYVGYSKEYAPHVEYGHRQDVGQYVPAIGARLMRAWIPGQYFFKKNVDIQEPLLIGLVDLVAAIQKVVRENTGIPCLDHVELNEESPFYFVQVTGKRPSPSKTMYRDVFTVNIHCIAEEGPSSVGIYELIQMLEEALTEDITLPDPYQLVLQTNSGINQIMTDETGEKHAVLSFEFMIAYGFKCK